MTNFISHLYEKSAQNNHVGINNIWKVGLFLLDLTWKVFCMTGNIDTYLLMKELESLEEDMEEQTIELSEAEFDSTIH